MSDTTAAGAGIDSAAPVISVRPVTLAAPERGQDLQVRVSAPTTGLHLPVVVFSHGMTLSMDNYAPLADFWAARGFVVIQPTHLDSLGLAPDDPRTPLIWRIRTDDLTGIIDQLSVIEAAVPGLAGRVGIPGRGGGGVPGAGGRDCNLATISARGGTTGRACG